MPFDRFGALSELLRRYSGNIINKETLQTADNFMQQVWAVRQKAENVKDQRDIVFVQLERTTKELKEAKKRFVTHYYNPKTRLNVIRDAKGNFKSTWKLKGKQHFHMMKNGSLGGGK